MKKKNLFLTFGVLTASVLLTACASRDEIDISDTPLADGKIKAQFNISIPQEYKSAKTRSTDAIVQEGAASDVSKFRGISDIFLLPFIKGTNDDLSTLASKSRIRLSQVLKPLVASGSYTPNTIPSNNLLQGNNAVLFGDVDVTIGTDHFLFYGQAIDVASTNGGNTFMNGSLTPYYKETSSATAAALSNTSYANITPANLSFKLKAIKNDDTNASYKETAILTYLNSILHVSADVGSTTVTWAKTSNLELSILYNNFKSMRAGSSACLKAALEMLYFEGIKSKMSDAELGSEVTALATAIGAAIMNNTYVDVDNVDDTNKKLTFQDNIDNYPEVMPAGSAVLGTKTESGVESFVYLLSDTNPNYFVDATTLNVPSKDRYVYPANLYYFGNSGIVVSNDLMTDNYSDNTGAGTSKEKWEAITDLYTAGTAIASTTKSVAITDQIQYAVARLDVKVSTYKDGTTGTTTLKDATNTPTVNINDLKITGILIGGQRDVNWKFECENTASTEYIIYDDIKKSCNLPDQTVNNQFVCGGIALTNNSFSGITNSSTGIGFNHTLVLQTKKYTPKVGETAASGDEKVKILLELQNNGPAFMGKGGTIGSGCKFYLLGELDMTKLSTTKKSDYIFEQDHITCANLTIASLQNAVNVIPDLRDPQIELGLSVDLTWQTGNTFDIEIK